MGDNDKQDHWSETEEQASNCGKFSIGFILAEDRGTSNCILF
jgi:hypothetical protein